MGEMVDQNKFARNVASILAVSGSALQPVICYKDPYEPISFTKCHKGFERLWHEDSKALGSGKVSRWVIH